MYTLGQEGITDTNASVIMQHARTMPLKRVMMRRELLNHIFDLSLHVWHYFDYLPVRSRLNADIDSVPV